MAVDFTAFWSAPPANATHASQANSGKLNSANWRICLAVSAGGSTAVDAAIARIDSTIISATVVNCQAGSPNVTSYTNDYPETWYGLTTCDGAFSGGLCTYKATYLNLRTATTAQQRRKSATHEYGHVAGLGHRDGDFTTCMASGDSPPVSEYLENHDVSAIALSY